MSGRPTDGSITATLSLTIKVWSAKQSQCLGSFFRHSDWSYVFFKTLSPCLSLHTCTHTLTPLLYSNRWYSIGVQEVPSIWRGASREGCVPKRERIHHSWTLPYAPCPDSRRQGLTLFTLFIMYYHNRRIWITWNIQFHVPMYCMVLCLNCILLSGESFLWPHLNNSPNM